MSFRKKQIGFFFFARPLFLLWFFFPFFSYSLLQGSCIDENKNFISDYFAGRSHSTHLENFFDCIDNTIQLFLNHTTTGNPQYYTQTELRRFMQYMGANRAKAEQIAQSMTRLKKTFIGGDGDKITLSEIALSRYILSLIRDRARAVQGTIPNLLSAVQGQNISRSDLITSTDVLKTNLKKLAYSFSSLSFYSDLPLLKAMPQNIHTMGFSNSHLHYWNPSMSLLSKWKEAFSSPSSSIIHSSEWPFLMESFSELLTLWFYKNRFLDGRNWLEVSSIQHVQHFISYCLDIVRKALYQSNKEGISLQSLDELGKKVWFIPFLSTPVARLSARSLFCFILNPVTTGKTCEHRMDFQSSNIQMVFSDLSFTLRNPQKIFESSSGKKSDIITASHLDVLRTNLNDWIRAENQLRKTKHLPTLFGSPQNWQKRNINYYQNRLVFQKNKNNKLPLLSHLNWQSHLMKFISTAYAKRGKPLNSHSWKTFIKEWTALSLYFYTDVNWPAFQKTGEEVFNHGDFLTSYSNGDKILQPEEVLEMFSLLSSSFTVLISSLDSMKKCQSVKTYYLTYSCFWNFFSSQPNVIFAGFPLLKQYLQIEQNKIMYISILKSTYKEQDLISFKQILEVILFMHYQENILEHLDTDHSQNLNIHELEPVLKTFENRIIEDIPVLFTKREAFAFITYLFHYGQIPIFSKTEPVLSPVRFSWWMLHPEKWNLSVQRKDILKTLLLLK